MRTPLCLLALLVGCNSSSSTETAAPSLITTTEVPADAGANNGVDGCTFGGLAIASGLDDGTPSGTALNGELEDGEIDSTSYVCNGSNGDDATVLGSVSGTIAAGDYLSLTHTADSDALYAAQISLNGHLVDADDYSDLVGIQTTEMLVLDRNFVESMIIEELPSGDILLVANVDVPPSIPVAGFSEYTVATVVSPTGAQVIPPVQILELDGETWERSNTSVTTLASGDHLLVLDDTAYTLSAADLTVSSSTPLPFSNSYDHRLVLPNGDGFLVLYPEDLNDILTATRFDSSGNQLSSVEFAPYMGNRGTFAGVERSDGTYAIVASVRAQQEETTRFFILEANGALTSDVQLTDTYSNNIDLTEAADGSFFVGMELGGPDAQSYAMMDASGALVMPATNFNGAEPNQCATTQLPNGDFGLLYLDDGSQALSLQIVRPDGTLPNTSSTLRLSSQPDSEDLLLGSTADNSLFAVYTPYSDSAGAYLTTFSRGYLELRQVSDTEVRLYNWTSDDLPAVITAF